MPANFKINIIFVSKSCNLTRVKSKIRQMSLFFVFCWHVDFFAQTMQCNTGCLWVAVTWQYDEFLWPSYGKKRCSSNAIFFQLPTIFFNPKLIYQKLSTLSYFFFKFVQYMTKPILININLIFYLYYYNEKQLYDLKNKNIKNLLHLIYNYKQFWLLHTFNYSGVKT